MQFQEILKERSQQDGEKMISLVNTNTDFHSHLIPELDDGSRSYEESKDILNKMKNRGIQNLVLTPHFNRARFSYDKGFVSDKFRDFSNHFINMNINFILGAEIYLTPDILEMDLITMGDSNYIMLELSFDNKQPFLFSVIDSLINKGFSIILAHIERYGYFYKYKRSLFKERVELSDDFFELRKRGILFQVNWSEIEKDSKKYKVLKENEMIDFIGSDKHRNEDRRPVIDFNSAYFK